MRRAKISGGENGGDKFTGHIYLRFKPAVGYNALAANLRNTMQASLGRSLLFYRSYTSTHSNFLHLGLRSVHAVKRVGNTSPAAQIHAISTSLAMDAYIPGFLSWIDRCNTGLRSLQMGTFTPFIVDGSAVGYVSSDFHDMLSTRFPAVFVDLPAPGQGGHSLQLHARLVSCEERSAAVAGLWVDEMAGGEEIMHVCMLMGLGCKRAA